jgi:histidinol-phosphatase (PHP family)
MLSDGHVHSEWSWDARETTGDHAGSMTETCARAVELGLESVAFTDHLDYTPWEVDLDELEGLGSFTAYIVGTTLTPPPFDVDGYLESIARCRTDYPDLRILTGVEFGEPHRNAHAAADTLGRGRFERINGSLHSLQEGGRFYEPAGLFRLMPANEVMRRYLDELCLMIEVSEFDVLSHIQYATRGWPEHEDPIDLTAFEQDFRRALRLLARRGRALEVNTRDAFRPALLTWWGEEGGVAITYGSDAHSAQVLANGIAEAVAAA